MAPAWGLVHNGNGFQFNAAYLRQGLFGSVFSPLANEYAGIGGIYQNVSNSSGSKATLVGLYLQTRFDQSLRPFIGELPLFGVVKLGAAWAKFSVDTETSGVDLLVIPEAHLRLPQFLPNCSSSVFLGYTAAMGTQSLFSFSAGINFGVQL